MGKKNRSRRRRADELGAVEPAVERSPTQRRARKRARKLLAEASDAVATSVRAGDGAAGSGSLVEVEGGAGKGAGATSGRECADARLESG
jgi:hypothetical protein